MENKKEFSPTKEGFKVIKENGPIYIILGLIFFSIYASYDWGSSSILNIIFNIIERVWIGLMEFLNRIPWMSVIVIFGLYLLLKPKKEKEKK